MSVESFTLPGLFKCLTVVLSHSLLLQVRTLESGEQCHTGFIAN